MPRNVLAGGPQHPSAQLAPAAQAAHRNSDMATSDHFGLELQIGVATLGGATLGKQIETEKTGVNKSRESGTGERGIRGERDSSQSEKEKP